MGPPIADHLRIGQLDPADLETLQRLLARHGARPVHRLGQNFLVDPALRDRVADAIGLEPADEVLEVGAGPGALTVALAGKARRVTAVEIDPRLVAALREVTAQADNVDALPGDVLRLPLPRTDVVAGNIPYYLTGALLPRLLQRDDPPRSAALVVQREVAERWTQPGDWSLSTLAVQVFAIPELRFALPRDAFWPVPAVESALVVMAVRPRPAVEVDDLDAFFRFAERIFQFRRKQLGGILARVAGPGGAEKARGAGIDPARRPQTLGLAEWEALYRAAGNVESN